MHPTYAPSATPDHLVENFRARALDEGLVDVAFTTYDSPLGALVVAATKQGLARVAYDYEPLEDVLDELTLLSPRVLEAPKRLDETRRQLDEYFTGHRHDFSLKVDMALVVTRFRRRILTATTRIPFGEIRSYREMASAAGNPAAVRAAGGALGSNPLPIVIPCHRVLRSDGGLGGYTGGLQKKEFLLSLEGVDI